MSQSILYKSLFEVKIRHHFFLNKGVKEWDSMNQEEKARQEERFDVLEILDILPTADCLKLLKAHHCIYKKTTSGIVIGIKAKPDGTNAGIFKPFDSINNQVFRFSVRLKDNNFLNYTALPLQPAKNEMYVLTNDRPKPTAIYPALSSIAPLYENGKTYMPGDMLSDHATNQTKLYTALVKTNESPEGSADWNTENLGAETKLSFININDRTPVMNGFFTYTMKEKNSLPIAEFKDSAGNTIKPKIEILQGEYYTLQVDMLKFKEGFYTVRIGSKSTAYLDTVNFYLLQSKDTPFALIEINANSRQPLYNLLDQENLKSPVFEIRFRNRYTFWRYISKKYNVPYVTDDPLPLTKYGSIEVLKPAGNGESDPTILPNPTVNVIKPEALINATDTKYYSEVYIN